jgi:hypothetical protein
MLSTSALLTITPRTTNTARVTLRMARLIGPPCSAGLNAGRCRRTGQVSGRWASARAETDEGSAGSDLQAAPPFVFHGPPSSPVRDAGTRREGYSSCRPAWLAVAERLHGSSRLAEWLAPLGCHRGVASCGAAGRECPSHRQAPQRTVGLPVHPSCRAGQPWVGSGGGRRARHLAARQARLP